MENSRMTMLIKKEKKLIAAVIFLTAVLILMFQYVMGQRDKYYDLSKDPVWNGNPQTIAAGESFTQAVNCTKDSIVGVMLYIEKAETDAVNLQLTIYDDKGTMLGQQTQVIGTDVTGYCDIFLKESISGLKKRRLQCEYKNLAGGRLILKGGDCEDVLCSESGNVCTRLIFQVLEIPKYKRTVYFWGILIWLLSAAALIFMSRRKVRPEYMFVFLYVLAGVMYMVSNPLYGVPDEGNHFLRAYGITEGSLITDQNERGAGGSMLPDNISYNSRGGDTKIPDIAEAKDVSLSSRKVFTAYGNTALYSPFTYTAQVIGIFFGRLLSNKIIFIAYCGRIAAWLTVGIMLFYSIKYIPFGKHILTAAAMLPMNMHESISLAGDSFTFAVSASFITFVLYARYRQTKVFSGRQYVIFYILLFFLASCKIVYVPLCMAAFLIPIERFGNKKKYVWNIVCSVVLVVAASIGWLAVSAGFLVEFRPGVNSGEQLQFIFSHPAEYVEIFIRTVLDQGEGLLKSMLGSSLGHFNVTVNVGIVIMAVISIAYAYVNEEEGWADEKALWPRGILFSACACTVILIYTSLYIQWTAVGSDFIDGVQGRYFLPILLPFILVFRKKSKNVSDEGSGIGAGTVWYLMILLVSILTAVTCLSHYII